MPFSPGAVLTAAGLNAVTLTTGSATTYVPAVGGSGGATFTTQTGWYYSIGSSLVFFTAYLVVNGAGSGGSNVTVDAPTSIDRTTRQVVGVTGDNVGSGGTFRSGWAQSATSGSGATWDKIRLINSAADGESALTGAQLTNTEILTIQGWYRQA